MNAWIFLLLAPSASGSRLRTGSLKTNVTKASAEVLELQHNFNSVYVSLKAHCKAPGVSDALNALTNVKNLKGSNAFAGKSGAQCTELCKGDPHCITICSDVRTMICDASGAPGVIAVTGGDASSVAAAAATAATTAVRDAIKDAVGQAAKYSQEAAKASQAAVKQAAEESSKIAKESARLSAKNAAEAAAKAASTEASIGAHAVASTAAAAAMAATVGKAKGGDAPAGAPAPGPGPAPAGL
eukprot:gnl/MRDRNA2_/MRDRNA2_94706_c0_seq1.p1 gnl/MRDRNA2_/MRDRNA2_94706_c0~~gnl/MRDRNA2_/MRDRNA2_94706_c0_seq1.p1  ORF type:complete len:242 (+),score=71.67 gnl/MRDRNA2_/MRDRNA2_94706_c0_seq1:93-818(+)